MKKGAKGSSGLRVIIAGNIKNLRRQAGLSQEALADACGYHRTYIGAIERGERNITIATLETLASAFHVTPESLLTKG
jgi:transcriptional regulator with XRE-family HTH domain